MQCVCFLNFNLICTVILFGIHWHKHMAVWWLFATASGTSSGLPTSASTHTADTLHMALGLQGALLPSSQSHKRALCYFAVCIKPLLQQGEGWHLPTLSSLWALAVVPRLCPVFATSPCKPTCSPGSTGLKSHFFNKDCLPLFQGLPLGDVLMTL